MNQYERKQKWRAIERHALLFAAALDEFTIEDLWQGVPGLSYQMAAKLTLQWWREGLTIRRAREGVWRPGADIVTNRSFPGKATYRWLEDDMAGGRVVL